MLCGSVEEEEEEEEEGSVVGNEGTLLLPRNTSPFLDKVEEEVEEVVDCNLSSVPPSSLFFNIFFLCDAFMYFKAAGWDTIAVTSCCRHV